MIKILNWRKLFSEQNIIFVHLNICSSLVPALADLRSVCTLCLQLVAFLEAGFGNEMEISVRNSQWQEISVRNSQRQEISGGIVSDRKLRHSHPRVQNELPLGLIASIQLVLVRIVECLICQGARLNIKIRYGASIKCLPRGSRLNSSTAVCSWTGCTQILLPEKRAWIKAGPRNFRICWTQYREICPQNYWICPRNIPEICLRFIRRFAHDKLNIWNIQRICQMWNTLVARASVELSLGSPHFGLKIIQPARWER